MSGRVYLVGAGPGDPGLLTLRARECLERADVVFYDALVSPRILSWAPERAARVFVGKRAGLHAVPQAELNRALVDAARDGKVVVRLKGGDPFVFGRGGEEAEELVAAGVAFEVVPGVTSPVAAAAYAGIPLTHRGYASSVAFVTGHEDGSKGASSVRMDGISGAVDTVVVLMGMGRLPQIVAELRSGGRSEDTPVAVIQSGTLPTQRTVLGTLGTIADVVAEAGVGAPAIVVVGDVVRLRERLRWFDRRPLFGRRIVVTRARDQASGLVDRLAEAGADVVECPTIRSAPPEDVAALDDAVAGLAGYDWVVFASVNAVQHFWARLEAANRDARAFGAARVAAVGPATADALMWRGIRPDLVPTESRAEGLLAEIGDVRGRDVLLPRAEEGRDLLRLGLEEAGARVVAVTAYRTAPDVTNAPEVRRLLHDGAVDAVTFTSGSTVENLLAALADEEGPRLLSKTCVAVIGPVTASVARARGIDVSVEAPRASVEALADALVAHFHDVHG